MRYYPVKCCTECPNFDHSGNFTQGGAIPLCGGVRSSKYKYGAKPLPFKYNENTGRRYCTNVMPSWCPLPKSLS